MKAHMHSCMYTVSSEWLTYQNQNVQYCFPLPLLILKLHHYTPMSASRLTPITKHFVLVPESKWIHTQMQNSCGSSDSTKTRRPFGKCNSPKPRVHVCCQLFMRQQETDPNTWSLQSFVACKLCFVSGQWSLLWWPLYSASTHTHARTSALFLLCYCPFSSDSFVLVQLNMWLSFSRSPPKKKSQQGH